MLGKVASFYQRFKSPLDEKEEFKKFRARLFSIVEEERRVNKYIYESAHVFFVYLVGLPEIDRDLAIRRLIGEARNMYDLVKNLQFLFIALEAVDNSKKVIDRLYDMVEITISVSPLAEIEIARSGDQVILYPKGAEILDDKSIEEVLSWLVGYPAVNKPFMKALQMAVEQDDSHARDIVDNLRFALEQLLRKVLENGKNLERQKTDLMRWLESKNAHPQIKNMFVTLLDQYGLYQNDAAKHDDKVQPFEVELMIYLTGTFMRFIIQLDLHSSPQPE